jgi:hypothetical protein
MSLPYRVEFMVDGDDGVKDPLQDSSNFYKLRQDLPLDGGALVQRLTADFASMLDALWGSGYYMPGSLPQSAQPSLSFGRLKESGSPVQPTLIGIAPLSP